MQLPSKINKKSTFFFFLPYSGLIFSVSCAFKSHGGCVSSKPNTVLHETGPRLVEVGHFRTGVSMQAFDEANLKHAERFNERKTRARDKGVTQMNADKQASHAALSLEEENYFGDESTQ